VRTTQKRCKNNTLVGGDTRFLPEIRCLQQKLKSSSLEKRMRPTNTHQVIFHNPTGQPIDKSAGWLKKTENTRAGKVTHVFQRQSKDNAGKIDKFLAKVSDLFSGIKKAEKSSTLAKLNSLFTNPQSQSHFGLNKFNPNLLLRNIRNIKDNSDIQDLLNQTDPGNATLNETLTKEKYEIKFDTTEYKP
jgi:hypothetical protein